MIIWTGLGFVIGLLGFICLLLTQICVNTAMKDDQFYQTHGWPKLLGFCLAATLSFPLGRAMNRGTERVLIDPDTDESFVVRFGGGHSLFFVPVQYWWIVFLGFGVFFWCA